MARKLNDYFREDDLRKDWPVERFDIDEISAIDTTNPTDGSEPQEFISVLLKRHAEDKNNLSANIVKIRKAVFKQTHPGVFDELSKILESGIDYSSKYFMLKHFTIFSKKYFKFKVLNESTGELDYAKYRSDNGDNKAGDIILSNKHTFTLFLDVDTLQNQATRLMNRLKWVELPDQSPEDDVDSSKIVNP